MNNTPDYKNNLAFAPGDWSDSRVTGNTDRTATTIQLIEKIEELEKENKKLKRELLTMRDVCLLIISFAEKYKGKLDIKPLEEKVRELEKLIID